MPVSDPRPESRWSLARGAGRGDPETRAVGAYLGLAVGDALGASLEFLTPREIRERHGEHRDLTGGGWLRLRRGQVTDDTEMSLALGRSILEAGEVRPAAVAEAFSAWMRTKPVDIGHTVRRGISHYRRTGETSMPPNEFDAGNGACMRCLPVALAFLGADPAAVAEANRRQSHVTHHSALADLGTLAVIRMVQDALLGGDLARLRHLADELVAADGRYRFDGRPMENPSGFIVDTLKAVFQALFTANSFEDALVDVVNRGGDSDTTGAILGMIAGACYGADAIPRRWISGLDRGVQDQCRCQALELLHASPWARRQALGTDA